MDKRLERRLWKYLFFYLWIGVISSQELQARNTNVNQIVHVSTLPIEPYVHVRWEPGLLKESRYSGYYIDLLNEMTSELNITARLHLVPDGSIGQLSDEGLWNGVLGELVHGKSDIALVPLIVTQERQKIVDFTVALDSVHLVLLTSKMQTSRSLDIGVIRGSEEEYILGKLNTSLPPNWNKLSPISMVDNLMDGLERIRQTNMALILEEQRALYYVAQTPCDLKVEEQVSTGFSLALAVRKSWPLLTGLNNITRHMRSKVTWTTLRERWWVPHCGAWRNSNVTSASTKANTQPALKVLSLLHPPYLMHNHDQTVQYRGFFADLLNELSLLTRFNFDISVHHEDSGDVTRHVQIEADMTKRIRNGEADIALFPWPVNKKSQRDVIYTSTFLESNLALLYVYQPNALYYVQDLVNDTEISLGVIKHSAIEKRLKKSKDATLQDIWSKIRSSNGRVTSFTEGEARMRSEKFLLVVESTDGGFVSSQKPCDLIYMDQFMLTASYRMAVGKNGNFHDLLDNVLPELDKKGVVQRLFLKWINSGECIGYVEESERIIEMDELIGSWKPVSTSTLRISPTTKEIKHRRNNTITSAPLTTIESTSGNTSTAAPSILSIIANQIYFTSSLAIKLETQDYSTVQYTYPPLEELSEKFEPSRSHVNTYEEITTSAISHADIKDIEKYFTVFPRFVIANTNNFETGDNSSEINSALDDFRIGMWAKTSKHPAELSSSLVPSDIEITPTARSYTYDSFLSTNNITQVTTNLPNRTPPRMAITEAKAVQELQTSGADSLYDAKSDILASDVQEVTSFKDKHMPTTQESIFKPTMFETRRHPDKDSTSIKSSFVSELVNFAPQISVRYSGAMVCWIGVIIVGLFN